VGWTLATGHPPAPGKGPGMPGAIDYTIRRSRQPPVAPPR